MLGVGLSIGIEKKYMEDCQVVWQDKTWVNNKFKTTGKVFFASNEKPPGKSVSPGAHFSIFMVSHIIQTVVRHRHQAASRKALSVASRISSGVKGLGR